jgi:antitoxin MazE
VLPIPQSLAYLTDGVLKQSSRPPERVPSKNISPRLNPQRSLRPLAADPSRRLMKRAGVECLIALITTAFSRTNRLDNLFCAMYLHCRYMEKTMISRIGKWGNSLAVRLPKAFADEMNLVENASIVMMLKDGTLIIAPDREPKWKLEELLAGVTQENIHGEWKTGRPVGKEPW